MRMGLGELSGKGLDFVEVAEVEHSDLSRARRLGREDPFARSFALGRVAHGEIYVGARVRKHIRRLVPKPSVGARDEGSLARERGDVLCCEGHRVAMCGGGWGGCDGVKVGQGVGQAGACPRHAKEGMAVSRLPSAASAPRQRRVSVVPRQGGAGGRTRPPPLPPCQPHWLHSAAVAPPTQPPRSPGR